MTGDASIDWAGPGFTLPARTTCWDGTVIERYVTASWSCMMCRECGTGEPGPAAEDHAKETGHPTQSVFIMNYLPVPDGGTGTVPPGAVHVPDHPAARTTS